MSKWTHVFVGPGDGEFEHCEVTSIACGSPHRPEQIRDQMPKLNQVPGCERVRYVGSGKGDWWGRTMNEADPLVTRFQMDRMTEGMVRAVLVPRACRTERLP